MANLVNSLHLDFTAKFEHKKFEKQVPIFCHMEVKTVKTRKKTEKWKN